MATHEPFLLGLFGINVNKSCFFPCSDMVLILFSRLFTGGGIPGELAQRSLQLMSSIALFKYVSLSLCCMIIFLQTTPPSSRPIQQPPLTRKEEVSIERETGEFIWTQLTQRLNFVCFCIISGLDRLQSFVSQKVKCTAFYASPLWSVFTDAFGSAPCCFANITIFHRCMILLSEMENGYCASTCWHMT